MLLFLLLLAPIYPFLPQFSQWVQYELRLDGEIAIAEVPFCSPIWSIVLVSINNKEFTKFMLTFNIFDAGRLWILL